MANAQANALNKSDFINIVYVAGKKSRVLGYICIAAGILTCLTVVGVMVGWVPIVLGFLYIKNTKSLDQITNGDSMRGITSYININTKINTFLIILFATQFIMAVIYFLPILFAR